MGGRAGKRVILTAAALAAAAYGQTCGGCADHRTDVSLAAEQAYPVRNEYEGIPAPSLPRERATPVGFQLRVAHGGHAKLGAQIDYLPGRKLRFVNRVFTPVGSLTAVLEQSCEQYFDAMFSAQFSPIGERRLEPILLGGFGIGHARNSVAFARPFTARGETISEYGRSFPTASASVGLDIRVTKGFGFQGTVGFRYSLPSKVECPDCASEREISFRNMTGVNYTFGVVIRK